MARRYGWVSVDKTTSSVGLVKGTFVYPATLYNVNEKVFLFNCVMFVQKKG